MKLPSIRILILKSNGRTIIPCPHNLHHAYHRHPSSIRVAQFVISHFDYTCRRAGSRTICRSHKSRSTKLRPSAFTVTHGFDHSAVNGPLHHPHAYNAKTLLLCVCHSSVRVQHSTLDCINMTEWRSAGAKKDPAIMT